jgi:hypothetical protein
MAVTQRISTEDAKRKADECREMAKQTRNPEQQSMLMQMAETWERIGGSRDAQR